MTTAPKRWPQNINTGLNVVCDRDATKRTQLWEHIYKQQGVLNKLRDIQEDEEAIEIILRVQAKTCFKGPRRTNERP